MDYQGNYFPDEPDEHQSKAYKIIKGTFKWIMYGISFIIYALIFVILFINRDSKILEKNYIHNLSEYESINTEGNSLYRINTKIFMNEDGSLQLHNLDYSEEFSVIEIGVKFNAKKLTDGLRENALDFVLSDENGNIYPIINTINESRGRYGFNRIMFGGINIDLDSNDLRYDSEHPTEARSNEKYTLSVYRKSDNSLLYEFLVYDNTTTFSRTEYNK
ncbi:MAG: hypothetical protein E7586_05780 [Ruminococcaceae bacterium]|nr:hypothetical protein [Oscillospiraceae bacterium]